MPLAKTGRITTAPPLNKNVRRIPVVESYFMSTNKTNDRSFWELLLIAVVPALLQAISALIQAIFLGH